MNYGVGGGHIITRRRARTYGQPRSSSTSLYINIPLHMAPLRPCINPNLPSPSSPVRLPTAREQKPYPPITHAPACVNSNLPFPSPMRLPAASSSPMRLPTAQDVNRFPFEVIKKWLPSNARSKNPAAGDDCLDLQVWGGGEEEGREGG